MKPKTISYSRTLAGAAAFGSMLLFSSCDLFVETPEYALSNPKAVVPPDFLFSFNSDYNAWMDTAANINYHEVPLDRVFANPPFTRLEYEFLDRPEIMPKVTIHSDAITRRQLLWMLAYEHNLKMTLYSQADGYPAMVSIRSREDNARETGVIDTYAPTPRGS